MYNYLFGLDPLHPRMQSAYEVRGPFWCLMAVRIGNGCGFWGDSVDAPVRLAERGGLDYLTLEYLAELTMSILALQKQRDPQTGFASDFLDVLDRLAPILKQQPKLKVVTNAGGMNPSACAARARAILDRHGLTTKRIGVVGGDDLMPHLDELLAVGYELTNLDTRQPLTTVRPRVVSANAYLGARPIAEALARGADVVITGRVADASLTVGPAAHEFGWKWDDWDRLAAGTVAGHLLECGAQATGGLWCNWQECDLVDVGYPIAELEPDGSFVLTKPDDTGGAVNEETVAEQLLYEVGDPAAYLTPDVVADFTAVRLEEVGRDRVRVSAARGLPATDSYKVSAAYRDGFTAAGTLVVPGPESVDKARRCGAIVLLRLQSAGVEPSRCLVEVLGGGDCAPGVVPATADPPEVVLRVAVADPDRRTVERFVKELAPLVTSGPPGVTGYTGGRPSVREVFAYWPALLAKSAVAAHVELV
jgi:Acyclic terpene utilisation family protein AtuA